MLERLFGSSSRAKIIKFFCTHGEEEKYYLRELARTLDVKLNALSRELENLADLGFLRSVTEKHRKYYMLDRSFPLLNEIKSVIIKSIVLLEKAVVRHLNTLKGVQVLILTGLFVNQDTGTDILLVGAINREKIQKLISTLSKSFFQNLRFTLLTTAEFKYRMEVTDKFVYAILNQSPIIIVNKFTR